MDELNSKVKGYQDAFSASGQDPTKVNVLDVLNTMINDELFRQGAARDKVVITDSMIDQAYNQMMNQYKSMKIANGPFKQQFGLKAKMLDADECAAMTGHLPGGVCPFALEGRPVDVYLDTSLQRFITVFPACGSSDSCCR